MTLRHTLAAFVLTVGGAAHADAVFYDFQDFWGDIAAPTTVPTGLSASRFDTGNSNWGGLCWNLDPGGSNNFACGGFGSSAAHFSVQAQAGYSFDVLGLSFEGVVPDPDSGPTGWAVYTSLDNFGQALIGGDFAGLTPVSVQAYSAPLTAQNLSGPLEVRLVSTGRDTLPASAWLLDNIRLDVSVHRLQAVPEPTSAALVLAALLAAGAARRRSGGVRG
jgi:hypothetical protein